MSSTIKLSRAEKRAVKDARQTNNRAVRRAPRSRRRGQFIPAPSIFSNVPSGFPPEQRQTLFWALHAEVDSQSSFTEYKLRANGPYKPNAMVTSLPPLGYPLWADIYNHQVTLKSQIKLTLLTVNHDTNCGIYVSDDSASPYTKGTDYIEARRGTWGPQMKNAVRPLRHMARYDAKQMFDCPDPRERVSTIGSQTDSTPSDDVIFYVWIETLNGEPIGDIKFVIEIEYDVVFLEPIDIVDSLSRLRLNKPKSIVPPLILRELCSERPDHLQLVDEWDVGPNISSPEASHLCSDDSAEEGSVVSDTACSVSVASVP